MTRQINSNSRAKLLLATLAATALLFAASTETVAQDDWQAQYKVGASVEFTISGRVSDRQVCVVSENDLPDGIFKVRCEAFKQWSAGNYIVYGKSDVRPMGDTRAKGKEPELSDDARKVIGATANRDNADNNPQALAEPTAPADLPGTYWQLLSRTKKGATPKELDARPDFQFCRNGTWGVLHYGGAGEEGAYKVAAKRVVMRYEGGELYGDFAMTRNGNTLVLDDGEYVLQLRYINPVNC